MPRDYAGAAPTATETHSRPLRRTWFASTTRGWAEWQQGTAASEGSSVVSALTRTRT